MAEHVIDANVFIHGSARELPFEEPVTVPAVTAELESREARTRFDVERVDVYAPSDAAVDRVRDTADDVGEELSEADVQVVALALDRDAVVVSDDYGVQNVARTLGVDVAAFRQEEIDDTVTWERVCRSCGAAVSGEQCQRCGGEAKRVPADR